MLRFCGNLLSGSAACRSGHLAVLILVCCQNSVTYLLNFVVVTAPGEVMPVGRDDVTGVEEDREFVWDDYLEETKSIAAPATSFKHVR